MANLRRVRRRHDNATRHWATHRRGYERDRDNAIKQRRPGGSPAALFLILFLILPVGFLPASSLLTQTDAGHIGWPLTLDHYAHFFNTASRVLVMTLRISAVTTLGAAALGYPVALAVEGVGDEGAILHNQVVEAGTVHRPGQVDIDIRVCPVRADQAGP
jgi:ABC-type Fe3+ transport system permease subunit